MFDNIRADIALKQEWFLKGEGGLVRKLRVWIEPGTLAVVTYRYGFWVRSVRVPVLRGVLLVPYALAKLIVVVVGQIYISSHCPIGKGLVIHNFSGIFLRPERMGKNCIVFQGVTVGHLRHTKGRRSGPSIGDNVFLGAGCKVLGDVTIGNNVVVGANSLVITSVPDDCTMVGVPARAIPTKNWTREKFDQIAAGGAHSEATDG